MWFFRLLQFFYRFITKWDLVESSTNIYMKRRQGVFFEARIDTLNLIFFLNLFMQLRGQMWPWTHSDYSKTVTWDHHEKHIYRLGHVKKANLATRNDHSNIAAKDHHKKHSYRLGHGLLTIFRMQQQLTRKKEWKPHFFLFYF